MSEQSRNPMMAKRQSLIDRLTEGRDPGIYREKRTAGNTFLKGVLMPARMDLEPFSISICEAERSAGGHVIASEVDFPAMDHVDLVIKTRRGDRIDLSGRVEASREGRRVEDRKHQPPLRFGVFHPLQPWKR